ncbi:MAG: hypothetical protein AAGA56_08450, partial [Myxococcota bacterium]
AVEAEAYIMRSQLRGGGFRYLVDPYTGKNLPGPPSLARHAGTTLALCELGRHERKRVKRVIRRATKFLSRLETPVGNDPQRAVLRREAKAPKTGFDARLGGTALATAALLRCRPVVGPKYDPLIGRLARTLTSAQKADGSFFHNLSVDSGEPVAKKGSIYVDGQMVLALSLLEAVADENPDAFPPREEVHAAVENAMSFFAHDYWPSFLRPLLYLEENWHCIAAAASLPHHRHDGYERFCLDYVSFKGRLIHEPGEDAPEDFIGGYGFSRLAPPHNTATAGYGEALAAALAVMHARGEDTEHAAARLSLVLSFLLRNQYRAESTFAVADKMTGAFSEHMASPRVRIDYVQHAWAAIGHGRNALFRLSNAGGEG